uniref:WRKY family protein 11 n=1 Tax=Cistanche tubulosa TaxID=161397 RepID=A0A6B9ENF0_9LAMI|nr:WRKY family protein 11 [Cistanche tubulosa]
MSNSCSLITELLDEKSSSLGFMELLNTQDVFGTSVLQAGKPSTEPSIHPADQDLKPRVRQPPEVFNAPATPNTSSISSESNDHEQTKEEEDGGGGGGRVENQKIKKMLKPKKTSQKREREPRFAFMTKSQVEHLEDGYRWRKYGQKAVKNSPFPRSYYRCTNSLCNVKKRVERSSNDPSIVVTTYEGQHTHPSPHLHRPIAAIGPPPPPYSGFSPNCAATLPSPPQTAVPSHNQQHFVNYSVLLNSCGYDIGSTNTATQPRRFCSKPSPSPLLTDRGLLEDVVPRSVIKEE